MKDYIQNLLERRLSTPMKNRNEIIEGFNDAGSTLIKAGYELEGKTVKDLTNYLKQNPDISKPEIIKILEIITCTYFSAHFNLKDFINSGGTPSKMVH